MKTFFALLMFLAPIIQLRAWKQGTVTIKETTCSSSTGITGTCMFHHKCREKAGSVLATCIDGFVFGVCCLLSEDGNTIANSVVTEDTANVKDTLETVETIVENYKNSSTPSTDDYEDDMLIKVQLDDVDIMIHSILDNVLEQFDENVGSLLLHLFPDQGVEEHVTTKELLTQSTVPSIVTTTTTESSTTTTKKPTKQTTVGLTTSIPSKNTTKISNNIFNYKKDCGVVALRQARIVGGSEATFGDWPWQVLVKEDTWLGLFTKNKCGGVLISDRHVLTAAHCQPGFLASLKVILGEHNLAGPTEHMPTMQRTVKRVVVHKDYKAPTFENDIAVLELESNIDRKPHIVPICMPKLTDSFEGRTAIVAGWGRLKYGGNVPNVLHQVPVPIMNNTFCQILFTKSGHVKRVRDSFLCAGYEDGVMDSCEGDSGGPLALQQDDGKWILAGTVSHGIKCAYPNLPGVYMRMTYYKPWIEKVTGLKL